MSWEGFQVGDEVEVTIRVSAPATERGTIEEVSFEMNTCLIRWRDGEGDWFHHIWIRKISLLELMAEAAL